MISKPIVLTFLTGAIFGLGGGEVARQIPRFAAPPDVPPTALAQPVEPYHTVSWFKDHAAERTQQLAACQDDPGHWAAMAYCDNADRAELLVSADAELAEIRQAFPNLAKGVAK